MKIHVLTVKQPWAHLIVHGYRRFDGIVGHKSIENRSRRTNYRGTLYIHAGKSFDAKALDDIGNFCPAAKVEVMQSMARIIQERGKIIGRVQLLGCGYPELGSTQESCWAEVGAWHWILADPEPVVPFPARGQLGIWTMDAPPVIETMYFEE